MSARTVAVVAYEMEGATTGVGRYLEGLLRGVAARGSSWRWRLYFKGEPFDHPLWCDAGPFSSACDPVFDRRPAAHPIVWEQTRLPRLLRRAGHDLLFSPSYSLPPRTRLPAIVTLHDLSFEHLPSEFGWKERWRRRWLARRAARRATRVLTVSDAMRRDLVRTYGLDPGRVGVVPNAVDPKVTAPGSNGPSAADDAACLAELADAAGAAGRVRPPYLLFLGSLLPRRHVERVIGAFAAAAADHPDLRLVLAGANRLRRPAQLAEWIAAAGCGERIVEVGYVPEAALLPLYRRATLTFYLSSYEGYGIPPLESLAAGTPAIVTPGQILDELWPDYPFRAPSLDQDAVTAVLRRALADPAARRAVTREAATHLAAVTWERSAELLLAEMERAVAPDRR